MAGSKKHIRDDIEAKLQCQTMVRGDTMRDVKVVLGLSKYSDTQFGKALRSLCYNYLPGKVSIGRQQLDGTDRRGYVVSYVDA